MPCVFQESLWESSLQPECSMPLLVRPTLTLPTEDGTLTPTSPLKPSKMAAVTLPTS